MQTTTKYFKINYNLLIAIVEIKFKNIVELSFSGGVQFEFFVVDEAS